MRTTPPSGRFVLSYDTWRDLFDADPGVVNRVVRGEAGRDALVVGVLPPRVRFPVSPGPEAAAYGPMSAAFERREANAGFIRIVARLKDGVPLEDAERSADRVAPAWGRPLQDDLVGRTKPFLLLTAVRWNLAQLMVASARPIVGGSHRALSTFVAVSIAVVFALSLVSVAAVITFVRVATKDLGFDGTNVASIWFVRAIGDVPLPQRASVADVVRRTLLEEAERVPGVTSAAFSHPGSPLNLTRITTSIDVSRQGAGERVKVEARTVTRGYFELLGMRRLAGRLFTDLDTQGSPSVLVVTDLTARRLFGDRSAVGQVVDLGGPHTIVGVVATVHNDGPLVEPTPEIFRLAEQEPAEWAQYVTGALIIKASADPLTVAHRVKQSVVDKWAAPPPRTPPMVPTTIDELFRRLTAIQRLHATAMAALCAVSLLLAAAGVWATLAFVVARQSRVIALHLALGASPRQVRIRLLGRLGVILFWGLLGGGSLAWLLWRVAADTMPGLLVAVGPITVAAIAAGLTTVAFLAALGPLRRAGRVDALQALRAD